mgnify:CR=1 FL=1
MFSRKIKGSKNKIFEACLLCAKNCYNDGRFDISKLLLEKAIRYKENDIRAYFLLAEILEKMGKKQDALKIYREVMIISGWKAKDENFQKASEKIYYLTNPSCSSID